MSRIRNFVAEIHDIGKLVDKNKAGKSWSSHVFIDFDFKKFGISQPTSPSWWEQYHQFQSLIG